MLLMRKYAENLLWRAKQINGMLMLKKRTAASQMEHYSLQQETHAFEISKAVVDALKDLDHGLRIQLGGKDCIDLRGETALKGGLAIADVTAR